MAFVWSFRAFIHHRHNSHPPQDHQHPRRHHRHHLYFHTSCLAKYVTYIFDVPDKDTGGSLDFQKRKYAGEREMVKVMKKDEQCHNSGREVSGPVTFKVGGVASPLRPTTEILCTQYSPHLPGHSGGVCPGGARVCGGRADGCPEVCVTR